MNIEGWKHFQINSKRLCRKAVAILRGLTKITNIYMHKRDKAMLKAIF